MRKYVLICNDRKNKISFYYDFKDACVYRLDVGKASRNAENAGRKGGFYGGILGIFLYPFIGKASYHLPGGVMVCMSVLMGIAAAIWVGSISLNSTEKLFLKENAMKLSANECWQLYCQGKSFRIRYFGIKILFFVLECIYFVALLKTRSKVSFWMNVILCFMLFVCIYVERPICRICFKRRMKLQRKEEKNHGELHQTRI